MAAVALATSAWGTDYAVDPVTGSMGNPGTAASPWSTLEAVFAASPAKTFQVGDHIYLRRGDHGVASVTGINTGDVFIEAEPGHTPVVRMSMINAHHWSVKGLTILGGVSIDNQTNENSDYNTFENCYMPSGGFSVCGNYITLRNNHIRNGGIHFLYHSNSGLVSGNTIEDFYSDAMNMKGNYNVFEYNLVMNAHKVSGNHNDMFQGWASTGNVLRGNEFRAYSDPNQPDLALPGVSDVQGIGLFDGWYVNWVIENNVVFVDHAIGIWIHGAKGCQVKNNTVVRCGQTAILDPRYPNIRVSAKKPGSPTGAPSITNIVLNNAAERFELDPVIDNSGASVGITMNNIVVAKSAFGSTFLNWGKKDMHLKAGAAAVIEAGTSSNSPPVIDADNNARPFGSAWECGAFEYGYVTAADTTAPSKPAGLSAMIVTGYGVDLHWAASTDNRKVAVYDIYRSGVQVGRTRAGTNYLDIYTNTACSYTVQAFDRSDNRSAMSDPVGGTPPVPDTQAPSVPSNVVAAALSTRVVRVGWTPSGDNVAVTAYAVYRGGALIGTSASTNYTDTGLTASTAYSYTVQARDFAGNVSAASASAEVTTLAPDLTPPSVPANVTAVATSSSSIQIRWNASTDNRGVAGYNVYRDGEVVDTVTATNCADTGLSALTLYTYAVAAFDAESNESGRSATAAATTFEPVPVLVGEAFEYSEGANLNGLNGGTGWGGPWVVGYDSAYPAIVESGNLGYAGVGASGNHMKFWTKGNGTTYENLDRSFESLIADGGQTVWLGMVVALCNSKNAATWSLAGLTTDANGLTNATLFTTVANDVSASFNFGSAALFNGDTSYTPHLLLVKIAMSGDAAPETLTAYADPDLSADPATWAGVTRSTLYANGGLIGFSYRGGRASTDTPNTDFHMDEFRIGATWQAAAGQTGTPPPAGDTEAPSVPSNVTAVAQSTNSILITWSASTDNVGVAGYEVYRGASLAGSTAAANYTDTGLTASTTYSYTVKAFDATGNVSAASAPAVAATLTPALPPVPAGTLLVEETFAYAVGSQIHGQNGGTGWTSAWNNSYPHTAGETTNTADTIPVVSGLTEAGNCLYVPETTDKNLGGSGTHRATNLQRSWTTVFDNTPATYWFAITLQSSVIRQQANWYLTGNVTPMISTPGTWNTPYTPRYYFYGTYIDRTANPLLFLIKISMSGNSDNELLTCFVNPDLTQSPSVWTPQAIITNQNFNGGFSGISFVGSNNGVASSGRGMLVDELRLATTWQAAVGQPVAANPDANGNGLPDAWETAYFGGTNNPLGAMGYDYDLDGMNNGDEFRAGTDPTNALSVLKFVAVDNAATSDLVLRWSGVTGKTYRVLYTTNLMSGTWATNPIAIPGVAPLNTYTVRVDKVTGFWKIGLQE